MGNKNTCILCYEDVTTGVTSWTCIDKTELDAWKLDNPTLAPRNLFNLKSDILARNDTLRNNFYDLYAAYDLSPDSLDKTYLSPEGRTVVVKGIAPANRKYPIIVEDITNNRRYKVSRSYFSKYVVEEDTVTS